jgi:hypothetical protein
MEQYIHRVERGRVDRKIKKSAEDPKGMRLRLFCLFAKARPRGRGSASGVLYQLLLRL